MRHNSEIIYIIQQQPIADELKMQPSFHFRKPDASYDRTS